MESTCIVATLIFFVAFSLSGQLLPRYFSSQCTTQQGMCTAGSCACEAPLVKRELVTQDATPCFQCVDAFCPGVSEGNRSCASSPCECEDPSWPRKNVGTESAPCWQCVRPPLDLTVRDAHASSAPVGVAATPCLARAGGAGGLAVTDNVSACVSLRYDGVTLTERSGAGCLAWHAGGGHWHLIDCGRAGEEDANAVFNQKNPAAQSEMFCTGEGQEHCLEPAEYMCTTDPTQCSMAPCRCEDATHVQQELQTLYGTACFTCAPPVALCPVSATQCEPGPCRCADGNHVKVVRNDALGNQCFSCRPRDSGGGHWLATLFTFVLCIFMGLLIGCGIRRLWLPEASASPKARRRKERAAELKTWDQRWAENLEDGFETLCAVGGQMGEFFAFARPYLRQVGTVICNVLDACDDFLEPVCCALDSAQIHGKDLFEAAWASVTGNMQPKAAWAADLKVPAKASQKGSQKAPKETAGAGESSPSKKPAESRNPIIRAADRMLESDAAQRLADLSWDPLNYSGQAKANNGPAVTIPKEWMMNMVNPALQAPHRAAAVASSSAASSGATLPQQRRAQRKLQQRRESREAAANSGATPEPVPEAPIDESWIDEVDESIRKEREAKEAKAAKEKAAKEKSKRRRGGKDKAKETAAEATNDAEPEADDEEEEKEEQEEAEARDGRVFEAEKAAGIGEADEVVEDAGAPSTQVSDLIKLVGGGGDDALPSEQIMGEAMHSLFLLSGANDPSSETPVAKALSRENADEPKRPAEAAGADAGAGASQEAKAAPEKASGKKKEKKAQAQPQGEPVAPPKTPAQSGAAEKKSQPADKPAKAKKGQQKEQEQKKKTSNAAEKQEEAPAEKPAAPAAKVAEAPAASSSASASDKPVEPAAEAEAETPAEKPASAEAEATSSEEKEAPAAKAKSNAPRSGTYAEIARWAAAEPDEPEVEQSFVPLVLTSSKPLTADAPDFIPFSMMQQQQQPPQAADDNGKKNNNRKDRRRGRGGGSAEQPFDGVDDGSASLPITTVMISNISAHHTSETFRQQIDSWGMMGTYNFFYMMPSEGQDGMGTNVAFVNFVDATFASLCQFLFQQYQFEGTAAPFHVQGLERNIAHFSQYSSADEYNTPLVIPTAVPSQLAVNNVNVMLNSKLSPQIREQFHKTKLCVFNKKNKCALGSNCPFAHSKDELQAAPDLAKTKLCYNFFRRRCNDSNCKFAHGYQELRATNTVYKTELCRWWSYGGCKAGSACRYAHGVQELRRPDYVPGAMQGWPEGDFSQYGGYGMGQDASMYSEEATGWGQSMHQEAPAGNLMVGGQQYPGESGAEKQEVVQDSSGEMLQQSVAAVDSNMDHESLDESASDLGFSDFSRQSTLQAADFMLKRQQTAPPQFSNIAELPQLGEPGGDDTIVLRVKGTFMEAIALENERPVVPMRRSWSDGDLPQLSEVMEGMEDLDDDLDL